MEVRGRRCLVQLTVMFFFFSSRRRHTRCLSDWSSDVCSSDLRTATFMMLGNVCTRRCGFCAVPKGRPEPIDFDEPRRVAEAVAALGLEYAVITSVNRDDDLIGGARAFALVLKEIRSQAPGCRVEVLIPDFQGSREAIDRKSTRLNSSHLG